MSLPTLDKTFGSLRPHWEKLGDELKKALPSAKGLRLEDTVTAGSAQAVLWATNGRDTPRERGRSAVVPLLQGPDGVVRYWLGYLEEWEEIFKSKRYRFQSANMTFFLEPAPDTALVQIFRAEWAGLREWNRGEIGWQSPGAAHPHWQFDALGHYMSREERRRRVEAALALLAQPTYGVEEFGEQEPRGLAADLVGEEEVDLSWTHMHFAAGARWHERRWQGDSERPEPHAWAPSDLSNIRDWVTSAVFYAREELLKTCKGCTR